MSRSQLEALPTNPLLARLKRLHQVGQYLALSNREANGYKPLGFIELKESPEWIAEYITV